MNPESKTKSRKSISREEVLVAAIRCLNRLGVERTRIVDIAREAGISRRTMYRLFETKEEVLQSIATMRIVQLADEQRPSFAAFRDLREALVEGTLLGMRKGRTDTLVMEIFIEGGGHSIDRFYFGGSDEIRRQMLLLWGPVLDRARENGELRDGITNEMAVEWIRNVHGMMQVRDDYDDEAMRQVAEHFLVPSLVRDQPAPKAPSAKRAKVSGARRR